MQEVLILKVGPFFMFSDDLNSEYIFKAKTKEVGKIGDYSVKIPYRGENVWRALIEE